MSLLNESSLHDCQAEIIITTEGGKVFSSKMKILSTATTSRSVAFSRGYTLILFDNQLFKDVNGDREPRRLLSFEVRICTTETFRQRLNYSNSPGKTLLLSDYNEEVFHGLRVEVTKTTQYGGEGVQFVNVTGSTTAMEVSQSAIQDQSLASNDSSAVTADGVVIEVNNGSRSTGTLIREVRSQLPGPPHEPPMIILHEAETVTTEDGYEARNVIEEANVVASIEVIDVEDTSEEDEDEEDADEMENEDEDLPLHARCLGCMLSSMAP